MTRHLIAALFALGLAAPVAPVAAQTTAPTDPAAPVVQIDDVSLGNPEAKVQVIEYASYTCPHCADFHAQTLPRLISDYIDTGKIHYIYREIFFDRYGLWAALIARCAGPERYFGIASLLYETQSDWSRLRDPAEVAAQLRRLGKIGGLEDAQLDACFSDMAYARALVEKSDSQSKMHNITGTPSLVINGTTHKNMAYDDLRAMLDAALAD